MTELVILPDLWARWREEFWLASQGFSDRTEIAGAEADRVVAILFPELRWFVRTRMEGEFPEIDETLDAVMIERVGGTRWQPLIVRMPCRAEDAGLGLTGPQAAGAIS